MTFSRFAVLALVSVVAAQAPEGKPKEIPLRSETLTDAALVPLALRVPVRGGRLPDVVGKEVPVQTTAKELRVDLDGSGRFATRVGTKKGVVVSIVPAPVDGDDAPPTPRAFLLAGDATGFWIAPASTRTGTWQKLRLELLDADGDGRFDSGQDWARLGNAPFHRLANENPSVGEGVRLWSIAVGSGPRGEVATLDALVREPSQSESQWAALGAANSFRLANGLGPMRLDAALCDGCQKHAQYLQTNGYDYSKPWDGVGSHDEDPSKPGFTEEGRRAAQACSTGGSNDPADAIFRQTSTMLHRTSYLGPAGCGLGAGSVTGGAGNIRGYSVVGGPKPAATTIAEIVAVPAPGSTGVPSLVSGERPPVERDPKFYDRARGWPISVSIGTCGCTRSRIALFDARGKPVPGTLFTPEAPVHSTRPENAHTAVFVADEPLDGGTRYEVEFTADHADGPVHWRWSFTTK